MELPALPEPVTKALEITRPRRSQLEVTEPVEVGSAVMKPESQLSITVSYTGRSLLFSSTGWTAARIHLKRCKSCSKSTVSVQTRLRRRITTTEALDAALAASAVSTKNGDVVDEV